MQTNELMERAITQLRSSGYKLTKPRRVILEWFYQTGEHATAQEVHKALKGSGLGLTSVYRNLEILAKVGLLQQVCFHDGFQRYEPALPGNHHHHLICSSCGKVVKFFGCPLAKLEERLATETGFTIDRHMLQIFGCCQSCKEDF